MIWLKKVVSLNALILFLLPVLTCAKAYAWSAVGHRHQTDQAFNSLLPQEQAYYKQLSLYLTPVKEKPLPERLHYLVRFPDQLRDLRLSALFARFGAEVPAVLVNRSNRSTATWHFTNNITSESSLRCRYRNNGQLIDVLMDIDQALKRPLSKTQEAILIGFQLHLIQDLHQPLHTFTQLDERCQSDMGGNKSCFATSKRARRKDVCASNLHSMWDRGFGVFQDKPHYGLNKLSHSELSFNPEKWGRENLAYFASVYADPDKKYHISAQAIVKEQNAKAIARLTYYLQQHARQQNQ